MGDGGAAGGLTVPTLPAIGRTSLVGNVPRANRLEKKLPVAFAAVTSMAAKA
jgi:hypothetical protein